MAQQRADKEKFEREMDALLAQKISQGQIPQNVDNNGRMVWPFPYPGCYITSNFGDTSNRETYHKGLDISIRDKSKKYYIVAALDGVVIARGFDKYMGNYVTIYHGYYAPKGKYIKTTYMHMAAFDSEAVVNANVKANKILGVMGTTGNSTGPHLHFQINEISGSTSTPVNPLLYVSKPY
jgi:murein DD-endopeptidase MepM/ murein hydrolase activator NlpD